MPRFCRHAAREYHMAGDRESPWEVLRRDSFHGFVHPWVVLLYYEPCAEASTTQPAWVDPMRPARMNGRIAIVEFSEMPLCHCQSGIALALVPSVVVRAAHSVCIKNEPRPVPIRIPPLSASSRPPSLRSGIVSPPESVDLVLHSDPVSPLHSLTHLAQRRSPAV